MSWKKRALQAGAVAVLGAVGLSVGIVGVGAYAIANPWLICRGLEWGLDWPEHSIEVERLEIG